MKVGFIGLGKLGLPVALAIESKGHEVIGYDINPAVKGYVASRTIPFQEEGLQPLLDVTKLKVVDSLEEVVKWADLVFLPVQTPHAPEYEGVTRLPDTRADFDYTYLKEAVKGVAVAAKANDRPVMLAVVSTCLPGTFDRDIKPLLNEFVHYVYTPQFIAMGTVLDDYLNPEFNLIGVEDPDTANRLATFYKTINKAPCVKTDIITAEGIKVSYNTWITAKTVIANEWGELAERLGMDFSEIFRAWSLSSKRLLSTRYMRAGMGDGGGCHPRDNIALSHIAKEVGLSHNIFEDLMYAREATEEWHAQIAIEAAEKYQLPLCILGRSFKPETNIETGSPAILMASIVREYKDVAHVEDLPSYFKAVYFIATQNERYKDIQFAEGSVVIDPFGIIKDQKKVKVIRLGRR